MIGTYALLSRLIAPKILNSRLQKGKLCLERAQEYEGLYTQQRPHGKLFWVHGASVGEGLSCIALLEALVVAHPDWHFLLTTGTKASEEFLRDKLPDRTQHAFASLDHPQWVERFYRYWSPDIACFIESELWPLRCYTADRLGIPRLLLNGRMSYKSFKRYQWFPIQSRRILCGFQQIGVQDIRQQQFFHALGATHAEVRANLKDAAEPLSDHEAMRHSWQTYIGDRPFWFAASTHEGEEEIIAQAHQKIRQQYPNALCLLAPRHIQRCKELKTKISQKTDLKVDIGQEKAADHGLVLIDQFGVLGVFYRLASITFIGGSLVKKGGHNLREAVLLDCLPICGPHIDNIYGQKQDYDPKIVHNADDLADVVMQYWQFPDQLSAQLIAAKDIAIARGTQAIPEAIALLEPFFAAKA